MGKIHLMKPYDAQEHAQSALLIIKYNCHSIGQFKSNSIILKTQLIKEFVNVEK